MNSSRKKSNRPFRIAFIPTNTSGVNYYRMAAWAFQFRKYRNVEAPLFCFQYHTNEMHPWERDLAILPIVRHDIECLVRAADVVVWQPVHYGNTLDFFNEMRQRYGKYTVVETDDNYVDVPTWNEAQRSYGPGSPARQISLECLSQADAVVTTTPHLKETYLKFNENIHVIQNSLDFVGDGQFIGWDRASVRRHKGIRIGWIGGRCHHEDLMMIAPALRKILEENPEVTLCLVNSALQRSCEFLGIPYPLAGLPNVQYADRSVPINRYANFMASFGFDIGLAPLVDCNFNRSKSNLRWLENSALKIPIVASRISHFAQTVEHGKTGLLVPGNDLKTWKSHIESLIKDEDLRRTIGMNAYRKVKSDFNVKKNAPAYIRLMKEISEFNPVEPGYLDELEAIPA